MLSDILKLLVSILCFGLSVMAMARIGWKLFDIISGD